MDSYGEETVFSTLYASSGCWKIESNECDRGKTAFTPHYWLYRFTKMAFQLKNAPETFQRAIDVILASVCCKLAPVHMDDLFVFMKSP